MRKQWAWIAVLAAVVACSDDPATPGGAPDDPGSLVRFTETFDGDPGAPAPFRSSRWDITKHSRDRDTCDDIVIDPARQFTILPATDRAYSSSNTRVAFATPAPSGAALRFAGSDPTSK